MSLYFGSGQEPGPWAGLQCLCVEQGTCPGGLEEARAQKGSWLHVCQGSVSLPSTGSVLSPWGHGVSWSRDSRELLCQPERDGAIQGHGRLGRSCTCDRGRQKGHAQGRKRESPSLAGR